MRIPFLIACLCLVGASAAAQSVKPVAVVIVDTAGAPLEAAVVTPVPAPAAFVPLVTNSAGRACCLPELATVDSLVVQHLGVGAVAVRPPFTLVGDTLLLVVLAGTEIQLPSATVLARYSGVLIRGDTVRFDAQRFADGRERDVADLMRQLPGIEVSDDGSVTYLGQKVDRLLLNGQDVLRSQFSALNALIGSAEVTTAEIVTERVKLSADETRTLNLNTEAGKALRVDAQLGISSHGDGIGSVTALYTPDTGWQHFVTLGYDGTGGSAISSQDFQQQYDWGLVNARGETNIGGGYSFTFFGSNLSQQAARRDHYAAQATASRTYGDRKTSFFGRYVRADEIERGREELFDARTGAVLGILDRNQALVRESAMLTVSHTDKSVERLSIALYSGLLFDGLDLHSRGVNRFVSDSSGAGVLRGDYAFRQNLPRLGSYLAGVAKYEMAERWAARFTGDYQGSREVGDWGFGDSYDVFGIEGLHESPEIYALAFDARRNTGKTLADARVTYAGDSLTVPLILQFQRRDWRERLHTDPGSRFEVAELMGQHEDTYTLAAAPELQWGAFNVGVTAGASRLRYARADLTSTRLAPLLGLNVNYDISEAASVYLAVDHRTSGFDDEQYWQTIRPHDTRSLTAGTSLRQPFSRVSTGDISFTWRTPDEGITFHAFSDVSVRDTSLSYLPRVAEGYVAYEPVLAFGERRFAANVYGNYKKDKVSASVGSNVAVSRSTIDPVNPTAYEYNTGSVYLNLRIKPVKWLSVGPGYSSTATQQTTTPVNESPATTRLLNHRPSLSVDLRGKRLSARASGSARFGTGIPELYVVDASVTYRFPEQPLELTLRTNDILNHDRSTFRNIEFSPGNLRATTYERIPGYVALVAKYTWGRSE